MYFKKKKLIIRNSRQKYPSINEMKKNLMLPNEIKE